MVIEHQKQSITVKLASQMELTVLQPSERLMLETEFGEKVTIELGAVGELLINGFRWVDLEPKLAQGPI